MATDMRGRPAWIQTTEKCRHYNGLMNARCDAGVVYETLRDRGKPLRESLPCWIEGIALPCADRSFPTEEEAKAQEAESAAFVKEYFASIADGHCPICHKPISMEQVGRCVYAKPCGHRLYQGTVLGGKRNGE